MLSCLCALLFVTHVAAQTKYPEDEEDDEVSWSLVLGLIIAIVFLAILCVCMIVVICEMRANKPAPPPPSPKVQPPTQTVLQIEPISILVSVPSSQEEEESVVEEQQDDPVFSRLLDGLYRLSQTTVHGRHARVITGTSETAPRDVALKVYDELERVMHEYVFYSRINSDDGSRLMPNQVRSFVPELYGTGRLTLGDRAFPTLVLERGHFSLRDFLTTGMDSSHYVVLSERSTFFQICSSLRFLHAKGFVHGDLQPRSIMFFGSRWKLIDFSLWGDRETEMIVCTTPNYTAPEIVQSFANGQHRAPATTASDVWALGVIGWEILTKEQLIPTTEYANEEMEEMSSGSRPFPWEGKPAQFWNKIKSPAASKIIQNCIHRDPDQRWTVDKVIQHMQFWS